jgi:hypothetical protein
MCELQDDVSKNFLAAIRDALRSSNVIAAKIFAAWYTSRLPACRDLVDDEMGSARNGNVLSNISRFVYFIFWQANAVEKRASGLLRLQVTAVAEKLQSLVTTGAWIIPDDVSIAEILTKIEQEGGMTGIYDKWRQQKTSEKTSQRHKDQEARAEQLGIEVAEVVKKERDARTQHQKNRDAQNDSRFENMITEITEEVVWNGDETLMLIVATRRPDKKLTLRKLREPYKRRMINSVVNPTTPIV